MQQLTQKLGSGQMKIQEIPMPLIGNGMVLIKNYYSIISTGSEGSTVSAARKSIINKAKERPQQVKQVLNVLKTQGPLLTYLAVTKKLDAYSPLGYSCAGEIIEVGEGVKEFKTGDLVACGGVGYANHAEVVAVPVNLCVKLLKGTNMKNAAYNTIGAISLQGLRQADLKLGESCAVIGLGLIGQLVSLQLKASGVKVVGIDILETRVKIADKNNAVDLALTRNTSGIEDKILNFTNGLGVDAVIIAAATNSLDPVNFAGTIIRKKGKVVILGSVPTGFERNPNWYKKELELKMSCSYGPGRYEINYEEKGVDYPAHYVRWTEKRNMEAFQYLINSGAINIDYLTTHEFNFKDATKAFDLIVNKKEPFIGIALKYDIKKSPLREKILTNNDRKEGIIKVSFIGAENYAQGNILPNIPVNEKIERVGILTNKGTTSKRVAEKFKFQFCTSNEKDIFNEKTNTLFIATRPDLHASYILKGLDNNKNIFVEKPLCIYEDELEKIKNKVSKTGNNIMIGFNRRFSPLSKIVKENLGNGPMSMIYRVNAGSIPKDSWMQNTKIGGGRIIGEVCHFIDYLTFINGSIPVKLSAQALPDPDKLNDTVNIIIQFENGATGVIAYYSNGTEKLSKEYIEIYSSGTTAIISDFKKLKIYGKEKTFKKKLITQNKGQSNMVNCFFEGLLKTGKSLIEFSEIYSVTKASFRVLDSIKNGGEQITI